MNFARKKEIVKGLVELLSMGANFDVIKEKFKTELKSISLKEIFLMEEELIKEGLPEKEIKRLRQIHLAVVKDIIIEDPDENVFKGHPIAVFFKTFFRNLGRVNFVP